MKIQFLIHYQTRWGESIQLCLVSPDESGLVCQQYLPMKCKAVNRWSLDVTFKEPIESIAYRYELRDEAGKTKMEYGGLRELRLPAGKDKIHVVDSWRDTHGESPFGTTVFRDCYFKREQVEKPVLAIENDFVLRLYAEQIERNRHIAIVGNQEALGNWDVSQKVSLNDSNFPYWTLQLNSKDLHFPLEYKFLLVDTQSDEVLAWGGGPNRRVEDIKRDYHSIVTDEHFIRTLSSWKGAGVAIPVFSLRSKKSFGIGEFYDLRLMVDWARTTGQSMIQILPINDTVLHHSNYDSYPYNAVSVYALHPVYLNLEAIAKIKDPDRRAYYAAKKKELNAKSFSDYQNVMNIKWEYLREIYPELAARTFKSAAYLTFFEKNRSWLEPYAVFSFLRDLNRTPDFRKWKEYSTYNAAEIEAMAAPKSIHYTEIAFFYFIQYHLDKQLVEVHDYARANGVTIKGDIPIGVSPLSVDAWVEPEMFNTHMQAGAPPDDFSVTGQNWGFPTYNWELMEQNDYQWWKKRFKKLAEFFDAYRIDHILGFFRIWEIPENDVWGLTGSFNPSLPYTVEDLQSKGLYWDEDRYCRPYLREHVLSAVFGKYTEEAIRVYFEQAGWQNYRFKPEFDTQKKIEQHFASLGYNFGTKEVLVRDGLYQLHCEQLFIRDQRQPNMFHPRISMHSSATFRDLPDETRRMMDAIYVEYYFHRHNEFWKQQAMKKLPALLASTNMLVCGEDLGMIPDSVPELMHELEILSLEIQRMPKKSYNEFAMPADAPYLSVCTTSTHDMNPIRAWWEEDPNITQRFYNRALGIQGPAPVHCEPWIAERIVNQHLESKAMLVILPWQDWMAIDGKLAFESPTAERINVPSNPRNFWCYRMHMSLEDLLKEEKLNERIRQLIHHSGR